MIIGLTGGIGSGKSTVLELFKQLNVPTLSADHIAHQLLNSNTIVSQTVIKHFNSDILEPDGTINRKKLASIVFNDPKERQWLESLLHPLIKQEILQQCALIPQKNYGVVEIPLLIETQCFDLVDHVLVVDCHEALQIERAKMRHLDPLFEVQPILDAQVSRKTRLSYADDIIDNSGSIEDLKEQVNCLHQKYSKE